MLKNLCFRYIKDFEKADDILHDAFIKIYNNIHKFKYTGSLEGWMKRIVVNTAIDTLNTNKKKFESELQDEFSDTREDNDAEDQGIVDQLMELGFSKTMLLDLLAKLPDNYAMVFNLYFIDDLSHKEIGDLLGISEVNSRKIAYRAKEKIKGFILAYLDEKNVTKQ